MKLLVGKDVMLIALESVQRLMAKDLDNWEQKRVQRFKGEPDGRL